MFLRSSLDGTAELITGGVQGFMKQGGSEFTSSVSIPSSHKFMIVKYGSGRTYHGHQAPDDALFPSEIWVSLTSGKAT